jgi:hypothetical protein
MSWRQLERDTNVQFLQKIDLKGGGFRNENDERQKSGLNGPVRLRRLFGFCQAAASLTT